MPVIDAWVNPDMPRRPEPWQRHVAEQLFKKPADQVFRRVPEDELLAVLDQAGIDRAVLTLPHLPSPSRHVLQLCERHPRRFVLSVIVDPRGGYPQLCELKSLARNHPLHLVRLIPSMLGIAPDHASCFPLYTLCCELGLAVSINTGFPPPGLPAALQDPMALDPVCLYFPELPVIMAHGAAPWWPTACSLLQRHRQLYLMTSSYRPSKLPEVLLHHMQQRQHQHRVIFASDFPFLDPARCLEEVPSLKLSPEARDAYLWGNAERLFFGPSDG